MNNTNQKHPSSCKVFNKKVIQVKLEDITIIKLGFAESKFMNQITQLLMSILILQSMHAQGMLRYRNVLKTVKSIPASIVSRLKVKPKQIAFHAASRSFAYQKYGASQSKANFNKNWNKSNPYLYKFGVAAAILSSGALQNESDKTQAENPAFTKDNIWQYRYTHKEYFIEYAKEHIATENEEIAQAIAYMIDLYPDSAKTFTEPALDNFADLHPLILKKILYHNASAHEAYVGHLLSTKNPHLKPLLENYRHYKDGNPVMSDYDWTFKARYKYDTSEEPIMHACNQIMQYAQQHPQSIMIKNFNDLYDYFGLPIREIASKYYGKPDAESAILYFRDKITRDQLPKPVCVYTQYRNTIHPDDLVSIIFDDFNSISLTNIIYLNDIFFPVQGKDIQLFRNALHQRFGTLENLSDDNLLKLYKEKIKGKYNRPETIFDKPYFMYDELNYLEILEQLFQRTIENQCKNLSRDDLEYLYDQILTQPKREALRNAAYNKFGKSHSADIIGLCSDERLPWFIFQCTADASPKMPSQHHFCHNMFNIIKMIRNENIRNDKYMQQVIFSATQKEKEEAEKGNYVFYHGRKWDWDFISDLYKLAYNLKAAKDQQVGEDYVFLRFDEQSKSYYASTNAKKIDPLFLNAAIFGNPTAWNNSAIQLVARHHDWSSNSSSQFTPQYIMNRFALDRHYEKYKEEFDTLKKLHAQANPKAHGSFLSVVIQPKDIGRIFRGDVDGNPIGMKAQINGTRFFTSDIKEILKNYTQYPENDLIRDKYAMDFILPLDKAYALDPYKGPRIYRHNPVDQEKWQEYITYRDQLFAKITANIEKDKESIN